MFETIDVQDCSPQVHKATHCFHVCMYMYVGMYIQDTCVGLVLHDWFIPSTQKQKKRKFHFIIEMHFTSHRDCMVTILY